MIDALWCDVHGVFVKGWAHAFGVAPSAIHLLSGGARATTLEMADRPDLRAFFPDLDSTLCGFSVYLACAPFRPVTLSIETSKGHVELDVGGLADTHPLMTSFGHTEAPEKLFISEMKRIAGTVLEIGARAVSPSAELNASKFTPECRFIGFDIHDAPGVDIVGDAHFLSDYVLPRSIDGVFSYAVVEHLGYPWLLAAEINKVLKVGGLTMHAVPHSFPVHEMPNDFWRMSSEGLKLLFCADTGFEVIAAGMCHPVRMLPHPSLRSGAMLEFALHDGMATSWILARKVSDLPDNSVAWPLHREASYRQSRSYPSHADRVVADPTMPQAPPFVADKPMEFVCPACTNSGKKTRMMGLVSTQILSASQEVLHLYRCEACRSLVYHPFPVIDYTDHTTSDLTVRDYVEFNAAIDLIAGNILTAIPNDSGSGRLLDIGCGFGFGMDAIHRIMNWQVRGYEPSRYGRLGREQLELDIVNDFARRNEHPDELFDIVHCSEVIEHVRDPRDFIDLLMTYLAPDGVLVLTTPDADRINADTEPSTLLALLSPGAHTILYSEEALADLLRAAGLVHVSIDRSKASMLVYASRAELTFSKRSPDQVAGLLHRYLQDAVARATPGSSLEIGLRYRLFRGAMDAGHYDRAEEAFTPRLADADPELDGVETSEQFAARWPICIAASTYYAGMLMLLHRADYPGAARHFNAAARLCRKKITLSPATAVVESDLIWRAVYHEALALSYVGETPQSLARLASFVDLHNEAHPPVPRDLRPAMMALRDQLTRAS